MDDGQRLQDPGDATPPDRGYEMWEPSGSDAALLAVVAAVVALIATFVLGFFSYGVEASNCGLPRTSSATTNSALLYASVAVVTALAWMLVASLLRVAVGRPKLGRQAWVAAAVLAAVLSVTHVVSAPANPTPEQCRQLDID